MEEASLLCDRIGVIDRGRIIATGAPRDLVARSRQVQTVFLSTAEPFDTSALLALPGVVGLTADGRDVRFRTATPGPTVARLMGLLESLPVELTELHVRKATLEDVFIELTRSDSREPVERS